MLPQYVVYRAISTCSILHVVTNTSPQASSTAPVSVGSTHIGMFSWEPAREQAIRILYCAEQVVWVCTTVVVQSVSNRLVAVHLNVMASTRMLLEVSSCVTDATATDPELSRANTVDWRCASRAPRARTCHGQKHYHVEPNGPIISIVRISIGHAVRTNVPLRRKCLR